MSVKKRGHNQSVLMSVKSGHSDSVSMSARETQF